MKATRLAVGCLLVLGACTSAVSSGDPHVADAGLTAGPDDGAAQGAAGRDGDASENPSGEGTSVVAETAACEDRDCLCERKCDRVEVAKKDPACQADPPREMCLTECLVEPDVCQELEAAWLRCVALAPQEAYLCMLGHYVEVCDEEAVAFNDCLFGG